MKKKILIIGGGVSGLAAGIYAQKCGFDSEILEKHTIVGGECTGWDRKGFHIDNCVHWLTGTSPQKDVYKVWCDVGVLGPDVPIVQNESFLRIDGQHGQQITIWQDLKRLRADLLKLAPEDSKEIKRFIRTLDHYKHVEMPSLRPIEQFRLRDILRLAWKMRSVIIPHRTYAKMSIGEYADRFKNPLLRHSMLAYLPKSYFAEALFYMYATFMSGNGALTKGGSLALSNRMEAKYRSLGGQVRTNCEVEKIEVENGRATGAKLRNGEQISADFVIAACDARVTFFKLLGTEYMDSYFKERYMNTEHYPVFSNTNVYFGCNMPTHDLPDMVAFTGEPFMVANRKHDLLLMKHFTYEESFAPAGQTVLQVLLTQYAEDFDYWQQLHDADSSMYRDEKARVAAEVQKRLETHFPQMAGKLQVVEVVTPYSFYRYCGAYKGAYMSFIQTPWGIKKSHNGRIQGLSNGYLAGQWLQTPGGMPNALVTGRFAIQRLCKDNDIPFCQTC